MMRVDIRGGRNMILSYYFFMALLVGTLILWAILALLPEDSGGAPDDDPQD